MRRASRLQRGCGAMRRNRRAATGHGHHGRTTARVSRIQQQVVSNSRSSFDLLLDANTEPCGRLGTGEPETDGRTDAKRIEACSRTPAARAAEHETSHPTTVRRGWLQGGRPAVGCDGGAVPPSPPSPLSPPSSPSPSPSPPLAIAIIQSSPAIVSRRHHTVTAILSSPSRAHHHPVIVVTATAVMRDALHRTNHSQHRRHRCHHPSPRHRRRRSPPRPLFAILSSCLVILSGHRHPIITIPSSPSRHHHPVITIPCHPILSLPFSLHHPVTNIPSSSHPVIPSGHHHPVITIPSSPSSPARGADLLGVDPRISTARRHLHPQAHRHRADLRTMSLAARAEDRPTRRTLKATWT